jgi:hypothetical protein
MKPTPAEYLYGVADVLGQREDGIGGPAPNCPTSEEMRWAADVLKDLLNREPELPFTPSELWDAMQRLAGVSDKWIDPEADPLGNAPREFLEDTIHALGKVLDSELPGHIEDRKKWSDLRVLNHCLKRQVFRQELNPPLLTRLRKRLFRKSN